MALLLALSVVSPPVASAATAADAQKKFITSLDRMMVQLAPRSSWASATIRKVYKRHMDLLVLDGFSDLEGALANGAVAPLPPDPFRFNLRPRVEGSSPIGEKDLDNQASYIAARPATVGALLEVASRVKSGPVEVTSLVRHLEYQDALRKSNSNANTSIPMHTMGLAFDISLINTPLNTVQEIRDVLSDMEKAGDILFIGERRQLVFHVVPQPSRLGHFAQVYADVMAAATPGANVIPARPLTDAIRSFAVPAVQTEVIALRPTDEFVKEWWSAANVPSDVTIEVSPPAAERPPEAFTFGGRAAQWLSMVTGLLHAAWNALS